MNKLVCIIVLIFICSLFIPSFAETSPAPQTFDYKVFENLKGYSYDVFDKEWKYFGAYTKMYTDAFLVLGIYAAGPKEGVNDIQLYFWIRDQKNEEVTYPIKAIDIMIDDVIYSYSSVISTNTGSCVVLGENSKQLVEAISKANSMTVRFKLSMNNFTLELDKNDIHDLATAAKNLIEYNVWDYITKESVFTFKLAEALCPFTISD